jgi:hypothetical protein
MGRAASPLTPLFVAIDAYHGTADKTEYKLFDVVSDRNNLRKLLRWATGSADAKDFRIDIDLAGNTCLFTRTEPKDHEFVSSFRGFGHEYEKAAVRLPKGCEAATAHHRIISMVSQGYRLAPSILTHHVVLEIRWPQYLATI